MAKKKNYKNENKAEPVVPSSGSPKHKKPPVFNTTHRKCTDIICLILFILFWIGMFIICGISRSQGQPEKLIFGTDWMGRTCGAKASANDPIPAYDFHDYKYTYYPRLEQDLYELQKKQVTSKESSFSKSLFGICMKKCPRITEEEALTGLYVHANKDYLLNPDPINDNGNQTKDEGSPDSPWLITLNSTSVLYRCLDLTEVVTIASMRCIDPCANASDADCGKNLTTNPFKSCDAADCKKYIAEHYPVCRTVQSKEERLSTGASQPNPIYDTLTSGWELVSRWIADLQKSIIPILITGGLGAIVISFIWVIFMKYFAGLMVWSTILSVMAVFLATTLYLCNRGNLITASKVTSFLDEHNVSVNTEVLSSVESQMAYDRVDNANREHFWAIAAYVFIAIDLLLMCMIIAMSSHINIAIGIVKQASNAIQKMPSLIIFPVAPTIAMIGLVIYWVYVATYIATSGEIKVGELTEYMQNQTSKNISSVTDSVSKYEEKDAVRYLLLYHLFGLLWTSEFLQAVAYMIVSGAICHYYWTRNKENLGWFPVMQSVIRTLRYHLGTIAFGSLLIAIVQLLRIMLEYLDRQTKNLQNSNKIVKMIFCVVKCCLWCFQKCLQFINRNAYIITAMKGTSFIPSVRQTVTLLIENAVRIATVSVISFLILLLSKCCVTCLCCMFMFLMIYDPPPNLPTIVLGDLDSVSSPIFPMIITGVMSYTIATAFLGIYETTIDTILICFCVDCQENKETGDYYMTDSMRKYIDGDGKKYAFHHYKDNEEK